MKELIEKWEKQAAKHEIHAAEATNGYTEGRLLGEAHILRVCADELRRAIKQDSNHPGNCKFMVCPVADKCTGLCSWAAENS